MKIITSFVHPPIPDRNFDWQAVSNDYEAGDPIGHGATKEQAVNNLKSQIKNLYLANSIKKD